MSFHYVFNAGRGSTIVESSREMGRSLTHEGNLLCQSWSDLWLSCEPGVDAVLEPTTSTIIGNGLSVWKVKSFAYYNSTPGTHIFLGSRTFTDTMARL